MTATYLNSSKNAIILVTWNLSIGLGFGLLSLLVFFNTYRKKRPPSFFFSRSSAKAF